MSNADKSSSAGVNEGSSFFDGFLDWLATPEGQLRDEARELTWQTLEAVESVDAGNHRLVMNDGVQLTIGEIANIIHTGDPEFPLQLIEEEVVGWLEVEHVPEGFSESEMERFERQIKRWIRKHQAASRRQSK